MWCLLQTEGLWRSCDKQVSQHHFSNGICLLCVSVPHFSNSCDIPNFFIIIVFVMVICDERPLMSLLELFWDTKNCIQKGGELKRWLCVSWLLGQPFPVSLPLLRPIFLGPDNVAIRPINSTMASKCSSDRKNHTSLSLNQELEMIMLSEEGMWKNQGRLKTRPPATNQQLARLWIQRSWRKLKVLHQWTHEW